MTITTAPHRLLRVGQAATILGVRAETVRRWADAGLLPVTRTAGGHRRIDPADLLLLEHPERDGSHTTEPSES